MLSTRLLGHTAQKWWSWELHPRSLGPVGRVSAMWIPLSLGLGFLSLNLLVGEEM